MAGVTNSVGTADVLPAITTTTEIIKDTSKTRPLSPFVTTACSEQYLQACARSTRAAAANDPLTVLFQAEKLSPLANEQEFTDETGIHRPISKAFRARLVQTNQQNLEQMIYEAALGRLQSKARIGAFVAEAGNWAAATCWEPLFAPLPSASFGSNEHEKDSSSDANNWFKIMQTIDLRGQRVSEIYAQKPLFAQFLTRIEMARRKHLYPTLWKAYQTKQDFKVMDKYTAKALSMAPDDQKNLLFWHLSLTSRNPAVQPPVPGAVRAIIEPFVQKWVDEGGMPIVWLEAGSERARDVYSYLGFRTVDEIVVGQDEEGHGVKTWCMVYTKR